jgi:hypothetical protein
MNIEKIVQESLSDLWNNRSWGGQSEAPRKDFGPGDTSNRGYNYSYQQGNSPISTPGPEANHPPDFGWPLQTVTDHFADAFSSLLEAGQKIEMGLNLNKSFSKEQVSKLKKTLAHIAKVADAIQLLDRKVHEAAELSLNFKGINQDKA